MPDEDASHQEHNSTNLLYDLISLTMTTETGKRVRARVSELPSSIPLVPVFEGEDKLDVAKEASAFLKSFTTAIQDGDWEAFGELFLDDSFWKDSLTLTFDKRTLTGRQSIVEAWKALSSTRKPSGFASLQKGDEIELEAQFVRMAPVMASLDVPFSFFTEAPRTKCFGQVKLIPKDNQWKVWVMATAVMSLEEHPFASLPRQSPSMIDASQRGKTQPQGLPRVQGVLDAVVIGASGSGLSNTIMLDAIGANVATFDLEPVAGGTWSMKRYDSVTLHHPAFMIQLPQFPVPSEGYPTYLTGQDLGRYFGSAIETLKLPVFCGIKVVSNTYDEDAKLWHVRLQDVETGNESIIQAKNIVLSTGFLLSGENPKFPDVSDQHLFKGPVQHTTEYRTSEPYKNKDVIVVGCGNSAHDVARNLALGGAKGVTILQRSPALLMDFEAIIPLFAGRYQGNIPVNTADFLETTLPAGVMRDMAKGGLAMLLQSQEARSVAFESKGYLVDRAPDLVSRALEERGRSFYADQPGTFELVFNDRIKIARGEARRFVDGGLVVHDKAEGTDRVLPTEGVVWATGYANIDLPKRYADTGFVDAKSASMLENVNLFGVDVEGENPGYTTFSGHPHLYFSGIGFYMARWIGRYTAIQVMADVKGKFPARYPRPVIS